MRKQLFVVVTLAIFSLVLMSPSVRTQEQENTATLEETLGFIKNMINGKTGLVYQMDDKTLAVSERKDYYFFTTEGAKYHENKCDVYAEEMHQKANTGSVESGESLQMYFNLADIDPLSIHIETNRGITRGEKPRYYDIIMETSSHKKTVKLVYQNFTNNISAQKLSYEPRSEALFYRTFATTRDPDVANRLERAFKHAVKLCGGKVDPF
jgi:hypothetical protein